MAQRALSRDKTFDWVTMTIYFSLVIIGWFMVFSTLYDEKNPYAFLDVTSQLGAQTLWVVLSVLTFIVALTLDWKFWNTLAFPIYGITVFFLIMVLIFGNVINGARAWFSFGFFSFQPAEWAKFGTALAVSSYLSFYKTSITNSNVMAISLALFLGPALLILLQPDFGSSLVYLSFFILLYRRGMSPAIFLIGFGVAAIFILSLVFTPYLVTVLLLFIAGLILMFDYENPQRASLYGLGVLLVLMFMFMQNEMNLLAIPVVIYGKFCIR